jgi:Fe-S cluster biogenesis protein NfuA/nitrite reductase/ring-hydroxylating ferredoxin subunit
MTTQDFHQRMQKIEGLVRAVEQAKDPAARTAAIELMQALMELHGAGIERMMEIVSESGAAGNQIIDRLAADDLVASLLLLYDLHPVDIETRIIRALDKVRPYLQSHGGNVAILGINDGVLRLKLQGSCDGCASSAMTLKLAIEGAIYDAAPDLSALEVEGVTQEPATSKLVQLERPAHTNGASNGISNGASQVSHQSGEWSDVTGLATLPGDTVQMIQVSGRSVLFCRIGETLYAYSSACPECRHAMAAAMLETTSLVCPGCGQRFDILRAGRGLDKPDIYLQPFPLLVERGQAKIALPAL